MEGHRNENLFLLKKFCMVLSMVKHRKNLQKVVLPKYETVHNKTFIHMKNHLNEQVAIE